MSSVSWADQQKINEFSKLNTRLAQHEAEIKLLEQQKEILSDAQLELELVDEDDVLDYKIGDSFVSLPQSKVMERLETDTEKLDEKIAETRQKVDTVSSRMSDLKSELYARFGNAINLERA